MRISFERTGGFAGLKVQRVVDSKDLRPEEAERLAVLLRKSHFFDLPDRLEAASQGADRFHYRLTVENDEGTRTLEASEASLPEEMRPLIQWLSGRGRP